MLYEVITAIRWATATVKGLVTDEAKPKARGKRLIPSPVRESQPSDIANGTIKIIMGTMPSYTPINDDIAMKKRIIRASNRYFREPNRATRTRTSSSITPALSRIAMEPPTKIRKIMMVTKAIFPGAKRISAGAVSHRHTG